MQIISKENFSVKTFTISKKRLFVLALGLVSLVSWTVIETQAVQLTQESKATLGSLEPDGQPRKVEVEGRPNSSFSIPLAVCAKNSPDCFHRGNRVPNGTSGDLTTCPKNNPNCFQPDYQVIVQLANLDGSVKVWISDSDGRSVVESSNSLEPRVLLFKPLGGQKYFLNFSFSPNWQVSRYVSFTILPFAVGGYPSATFADPEMIQSMYLILLFD